MMQRRPATVLIPSRTKALLGARGITTLMRHDEHRGREFLAPEELAYLLPQRGIAAAKLEQSLGKDDVTPCTLLRHEFSREQIGEIDRAEVGELFAVIGSEFF